MNDKWSSTQLGTQFHDVDIVEFEGDDLQSKLDDVSSKKRRALRAALNEDGGPEVGRRFHGAFTGGFSAGYHNTVGSETGFQPSQFVSSRKSRNIQNSRNIHDYLDDEDLQDMHDARAFRAITDGQNRSLRTPFQTSHQTAQQAVEDLISLSIETHTIGRKLIEAKYNLEQGCPFIKPDDAGFQALMLRPKLAPKKIDVPVSGEAVVKRQRIGPQVDVTTLAHLRAADDAANDTETYLSDLKDRYDSETLELLQQWASQISAYLECQRKKRTDYRCIGATTVSSRKLTDGDHYKAICEASMIPMSILTSDDTRGPQLALSAESAAHKAAQLRASGQEVFQRDTKGGRGIIRMSDALKTSTDSGFHRAVHGDTSGKGLQRHALGRDRLEVDEDDDLVDDTVELYDFDLRDADEDEDERPAVVEEEDLLSVIKQKLYDTAQQSESVPGTVRGRTFRYMSDVEETLEKVLAIESGDKRRHSHWDDAPGFKPGDRHTSSQVEPYHREPQSHIASSYRESSYREPMSHRESSRRELTHREFSHRESSHRESSHRESSHRESSHRDPSRRESPYRVTKDRTVTPRETTHRGSSFRHETFDKDGATRDRGVAARGQEPSRGDRSSPSNGGINAAPPQTSQTPLWQPPAGFSLANVLGPAMQKRFEVSTEAKLDKPAPPSAPPRPAVPLICDSREFVCRWRPNQSLLDSLGVKSLVNKTVFRDDKADMLNEMSQYLNSLSEDPKYSKAFQFPVIRQVRAPQAKSTNALFGDVFG
eukprot:Blabericola_migrator_1__1139@NODE_1291_length_4884_cov_38_630683_g871_i0_p1_GENE_NODE_1291_length_4884_cov_38_630683_g871_i0NODE_1291_length_4884_cov_38_630683_g871_i0_p1_ORF_typecomplete_len766_score154_53DUF1604/PF07713_13/4_7e26_NODE_1291_length_4884_cov_38_630683_g871_i03042601